MKKKTRVLLFSLSLVGASTLFFSMKPAGSSEAGGGGNGPWVAPKEADATENPFKDNATLWLEGKKIYHDLCSQCHGDKGHGDGIGAASMSTPPADHTTAKVQSQTDGAIFWKISNGRPPMAKFSESLSIKQRWALVAFIRTLKK